MKLTVKDSKNEQKQRSFKELPIGTIFVYGHTANPSDIYKEQGPYIKINDSSLTDSDNKKNAFSLATKSMVSFGVKHKTFFFAVTLSGDIDSTPI